MPIKKRVSIADHAKAKLGREYRACLNHPYMKALTRWTDYDTSPLAAMKAIARVNGWKGGTSFEDKVFVYILCSIMWRAFGESHLSNANFDRLRKHIEDHDAEVLAKAGVLWHGVAIWDERHLRRFAKNDMILAMPKRKFVKKKLKPKRRKK